MSQYCLYDPLTARWNGVDALAEKFHSSGSYNYVGGNPVSRVDLDGREYYYTSDGRFLGQCGDNDWVYIVPDNVATSYSIDDIVALKDILRNYTYIGDYNDLVYTAATAYGESSHGYGVDTPGEVYGIANAIHNYKYLLTFHNRAPSSVQTMVESNYAYAAKNKIKSYVELRDANPEARNGTFMQTAMAAGINAMGYWMDLPGAKDYAHFGTHWDGIDFEQAKYSESFWFSSESHRVFGLSNNPYPGSPIKEYIFNSKGKPTKLRGTWSYKWNSTALYGGYRSRDNKYFFTIIMRADEDFKKATGGKGL